VRLKSASRLTEPQGALLPLTAPLLKKLYEDMLLIRRFEERSAQIYGTGAIGGFCHLYIGQEAIAVGACAARQPQDTMVTAYRDHGHMLAVGMDPKSIMAELLGRETGSSKGKGGSMHMFAPDKGFFGGHGIVGAQVPFGTGVAFAHKYKEDNGVCLTFMGDGASNQGQVFEAFNMAALWSLPAVYIIENNQYSMGTSVQRGCAGNGLFHRGEPFGIDGVQIDGTDVTLVRETIFNALEKARAGGGPTLIEVDTYRYRGHSMSDPGLYRTKDEVEMAKANQDPLLQCKNQLIRQFKVPEEYFKTADKKVRDVVKESVVFAQASPEPAPEELMNDILREDPV
jgi:pyruvate dehydrogenase E1 component alpha subunit